jgi:hypothetical protein
MGVIMNSILLKDDDVMLNSVFGTITDEDKDLQNESVKDQKAAYMRAKHLLQLTTIML